MSRINEFTILPIDKHGEIEIYIKNPIGVKLSKIINVSEIDTIIRCLENQKYIYVSNKIK